MHGSFSSRIQMLIKILMIENPKWYGKFILIVVLLTTIITCFVQKAYSEWNKLNSGTTNLCVQLK